MKLSPSQTIVLKALIRSDVLTTDRLVDALYGCRPDGGPDKAERAARAQLYRLRDKLAGTGLAIEAIGFGRGFDGYRLKSEARP